MRSLLFVFFLMLLTSGFGQSDSKAKSESEDSEKELVPEEKVMVDSVLRERGVSNASNAQKRVVKNKSQKLKKESNRKKGYVNAEPAISEQEQLQIQNASMNFQLSKNNASLQRTQRSPSITQQAEMDQAVGFFEQNAPNSFEHHYYRYTAGNYDLDLVSHLEQAELLRPDNSDVQVQYAAYHMIKGDDVSAKSYLNDLVESGRLAKDVLMYAEDVLHSTPENGTLITHGFDDSYGVWYVQNAKGVRKDVELISLDFLQSEEYRKSLKEKGYVLPASKLIDVAYLEKLCALNSRKNLAISLTTPKEYFTPILSKMFLTGLVFVYKTEKYDNFKRNVDLWNVDLKKELVQGAQNEKSKQLSANYLPMLLQMRKVYNQHNDQKMVEELDKSIDQISVQCRKYEKVQSLKGAY